MFPAPSEIAWCTDTCGITGRKLLSKVSGQGKVYPSTAGCGLKSNRHNLSIRLKKATLSPAIEIAE
jgi:hypothetical protein